MLARINGALGTVTATVADPSIATAVVDQQHRTLSISGRAIGTTTITVRDDRGVTRDVLVRVAYSAGTIADDTTVRVTGDPASAAFLRDAIAEAATRAATVRPGARVTVYTDTIDVRTELQMPDRREVDVKLLISGENYISVSGQTRPDRNRGAQPGDQRW